MGHGDRSGKRLRAYEVTVWFGLVAPAGTPKEIVARLNVETRKAPASSDVQEAFSNQGIEAVGSSPEEFAALIAADGAKWSRTVRMSGT